jgi:thiol-disulfide isomerase/thioredoxin/Tfp pilus assembly protein PilF
MKSVFTFFLLLLGSSAPVFAQSNAQGAIQQLRNLFFAQGYADGIALGDQIASRYPNNAEVQAWYVMNLVEGDQEGKALELATALKTRRPRDGWSWFALAGAQNGTNVWAKESPNTSAKAFQFKPNHPDFIWLHTWLMAVNGKAKEAVEFAKRYENKLQGAYLANLLNAKAFALERLVRIEPDKKTEYEAEALATLKQAEQVDPQNSWVLQHIATRYATLRQNDEALAYFQKSFQIAPLYIDRYSFWQIVENLPNKSSEEKRAMIEVDLENLKRADLATNIPNRVLDAQGKPLASAATLEKLWRGYQRLKNEEKQAEAEAQMVQYYPNTTQDELVLVETWRTYFKKNRQEIYGQNDYVKLKTLQDMYRSFIRRPSHFRKILLGEAYNELFKTAKVDSTMSNDEVLETVRGMVKYDTKNIYTTLGQSPFVLADRKIAFREAEKYARDGMILRKKSLDELVAKGYKFNTADGYQQAVDSEVGEQYLALGWVFFKEGRMKDAEEAFQEFLKRSVIGSADGFYRLGQFYEAQNDIAQAEIMYLKGMEKEADAYGGENPNVKMLKGIYLRKHGNFDGYENYLVQVKENERLIRQEKVLEARLKEPKDTIPFTLKTLTGERISLTELKGKIVVINYWGVWCSWCIKEMPDFVKFYEQHKNDPDVVILTIDQGDTLEEVKQWVEKEKYPFPTLISDGYTGKMEIFSYPTTWFLDKDGKRVFDFSGYSANLIEEYNWRLEAMRGN